MTHREQKETKETKSSGLVRNTLFSSARSRKLSELPSVQPSEDIGVIRGSASSIATSANKSPLWLTDFLHSAHLSSDS
jgi:hypothetical protein